MPQVNAIEAADRDGGPSMMGLEALDSTYEFHGSQAPLLRM